MPSMLVVVFVLQLAIHIVNTIGASVINTLLWNIYNRLPTPTSKAFKEQKKLQAEFLALRMQLNATSSQDEFAKWAKLRRTHDKQLEKLEKTKAELDGTKAKFDKTVTILRWVSTNGMRMFLQFWYSKEAMFWLPQGLIPYYGEWLLSFPRAPLGSVSIQSWQLACGSIILLVSDAIAALVGLLLEAKSAPGQKKAVPVESAGGSATGKTAGTEKSGTKEL